MSLKAFHIVFVTASVLLAFGVSARAFVNYSELHRGIDLSAGIGSLVAGVGLLVYGRYFLRKLKNISYL